eukprot:593996-Hanusia_phi.AAC.1
MPAREKIRQANRTQDKDLVRKLEDTWWVGEWRGNGVFKGWWVGWIRNTSTDNKVHLKLVSQYCTVQFREGVKVQNMVVSEDEYTAFSSIYTLLENDNDCIDFLDFLIRTKRINPRNMEAAHETLKDIRGEGQSSESDDSSSGLDEIGCEICKGFDCSEDNDIVLCGGKDTGCGKGWHIRCLKLKDLPEGDWFCPECIAANAAKSSKDDGKNLSKKKLEIAKILSNCQGMFEGDLHADSNTDHCNSSRPGSSDRNHHPDNQARKKNRIRAKSVDKKASHPRGAFAGQTSNQNCRNDGDAGKKGSLLKNDEVVDISGNHNEEFAEEDPLELEPHVQRVRIVDHEAAVSRRYLVRRRGISDLSFQQGGGGGGGEGGGGSGGGVEKHEVEVEMVMVMGVVLVAMREEGLKDREEEVLPTDPGNSFVLFGVPIDSMDKAERERQRKVGESSRLASGSSSVFVQTPKEKRKFFSDRNDFR